MNNLMNTGDVKTYLLDLHSRILSRLEALQQEIALNWAQTPLSPAKDRQKARLDPFVLA